MALPWAKARSGATTTAKHYRNLERAKSIAAVNVPDASTSNKWFAKAIFDDGEAFILSALGYADEAATQTAIETVLGTPV